MKLSLGKKEKSEVVNMLQGVPLFAGLPKKQISAMAESFVERSYEPGTVIEYEGDKGISLYLVIDGAVDVIKGTKKIARLSRGQFFGELSLLDRQPRSASIIAVEPTKCLLMTAWVWTGFLETQPKLAIPVMRELARRIRETDEALSLMS